MTSLPSESYEKKDASIRIVAIAATALVLMLVVVALMARGALRILSGSAMGPVPAIEPLPPAPRLEANPLEQLQALRAEESLALEHYGWVDRSKGIVRIPIEQAMDLVARRGLPTQSEKEPQ